MSRVGGWVAGAMMAFGIAGMSQPAGAVALLVGNSLSVNGLNISITSCTLKLAGANQASCAAGNLEIVEIAGTGANVKIQGAGGGNIFSASRGSGLYDVTFTMSVSGLYPNTTVNSISMAMAGSVTSPGGSTTGTRVSAGETSTAPGSTPIDLNLAGSTTGSTTFPSVSSFNVTKDLKLNANGTANGDTLVLSWVTQGFLPAPEPVSIGLFLVGLAGLASARHWRRQAEPAA